MQNIKSKKIIIDARMLGIRNAGIGRTIEELVNNLAKIDQVNQYYLFLNRDNFGFDGVVDDETPQPPLSGGLSELPTNSVSSRAISELSTISVSSGWAGVRTSPPDKGGWGVLPGNWHKVLVDVRWYSLKEQLSLPKEIKKIKPDLVYFPHFNVPLFYRGKFIVTIHDLIWIKYPRPRSEVSTLNPVFYFIKNFCSKIIFKSAIKRAEKIIVPTEFTKRDIVEFYGIGEGKIRVVNWGVDDGTPPNPPLRGGEATPIGSDNSSDNCLKKCYNINKSYLLYVGSAYPHKNLEFLIRVFKDVSADWQLVLAGKDSYFYQKLKKLVEELGLVDKVIFTGFIDDEQLKMLYQQASVFVFPSLIEGFGLPPLEAMSHGVPVLSSNATCLPEVLGDAVLYFDSNNQEDLKNKILEIINNQDLRVELIKKGFEQVKRYDWHKCAEEYFREIND